MVVYDAPFPEFPTLAVVVDLAAREVLLAQPVATVADGETLLRALAANLEAEPTLEGRSAILKKAASERPRHVDEIPTARRPAGGACVEG